MATQLQIRLVVFRDKLPQDDIEALQDEVNSLLDDYDGLLGFLRDVQDDNEFGWEVTGEVVEVDEE